MIARFDPMEELVSCIMSQHTSDTNSFPTFTRLREAFPDWAVMAEAGAERVADVIRNAGLANQKAKSIVNSLIEIHRRTGEYSLEALRLMPYEDAYPWLLSLPGVGPKTASLVLCFSFGMDAIPVDTHVYRVSWRIGLIPEGIGEGKAHDLLRAAVPKGMGFRFHVALIQHGRTICKAPAPNCSACNLTDVCSYFRAGRGSVR